MPEASERLDLRLVPAALAAWAVTAAGIRWGSGIPLAALGAGVGLGWTAARWRLGDRYPVLRAAAAGVLGAAIVVAGFGIAVGLRSAAAQHHRLLALSGATVWVAVTPQETPRPSGPGRLIFRARVDRAGDEVMRAAVTVFAPAADFGELGSGQPALFRARIARPARRDLTVAVLTATGRPRFGPPSAAQQAAAAVRGRFASVAREVLPADQAAMLPGLVLGDTTAVPAATTAAFRIAGLTHLTAVSGANVTIVCGAVLLSAYLIGPRPAVVLAALALVVLVVVVQPTASVLRAAVMGAIGLLALLSGRRRPAVPVLSATVIGLLGVAPQLAVDVGFALSVSATAALVLLAPVWSARMVAAGWPRPVAHGVCVALAAHLVTAPLIAAISGQFSVVSVLANLIVAPVIPPITVLGTAAAALAAPWPGAAGALIRFSGPELWWLLRVAQLAARLPGAAIAVPSGWVGLLSIGCAGAAAVVLWPRRWFRRAAAAALLGAVAWSVSGLVSPP